MKKALKTLLDDLDAVAEDHGEVEDTDVREQMRDALEGTFFTPTDGATLPDDLGMFEAEGNAAVKAALTKFIAAATAESPGLKTRAERMTAFQNIDVESNAGNTYDEYFGHEDESDE